MMAVEQTDDILGACALRHAIADMCAFDQWQVATCGHYCRRLWGTPAALWQTQNRASRRAERLSAVQSAVTADHWPARELTVATTSSCSRDRNQCCPAQLRGCRAAHQAHHASISTASIQGKRLRFALASRQLPPNDSAVQWSLAWSVRQPVGMAAVRAQAARGPDRRPNCPFPLLSFSFVPAG